MAEVVEFQVQLYIIAEVSGTKTHLNLSYNLGQMFINVLDDALNTCIEYNRNVKGPNWSVYENNCVILLQINDMYFRLQDDEQWCNAVACDTCGSVFNETKTLTTMMLDHLLYTIVH